MIYKIYVCGNHGYEQIGGILTKKHLIKTLNSIMETITNEKVLVIEHDTNLNCDIPIFLNITDDYEKFKNKYKSRKKVKHDDKSDNKTKRN